MEWNWAVPEDSVALTELAMAVGPRATEMPPLAGLLCG
jgi:hypothetical protein